MFTPTFSNNQFVDSTLLNTAFGSMASGIAADNDAMYAQGGLMYPESMTVAVSGMTLTLGLVPPFALMTGSGAIIYPIGVTPGLSSTSYAMNLTPLVPPSGSQTVYLLAVASGVLQNPGSIPGPPPGHPSYNPNFQPTIGYQTLSDTLAVSASTTPANNTSTFELARTLLSVGQVSLALSGISFIGQQRATPYDARARIAVTGSYMLPMFNAATMLSVTGGGPFTSTLPPASNALGAFLSLLNETSTNWTIVTSGSDLLYGVNVTAPNPGVASGISTFTIPPYGMLRMWAEYNANVTGWFAVAGSPSISMGRIRATGTVNLYVASGGSDATGNGSISSPFATIQTAVNTICNNYDMNGFAPIVNVSSGVYAAFAVTNTYPGANANTPLRVQGTESDPSRVTISAGPASGTVHCVYVAFGCSVLVSGMTLTTTATGGNGILTNYGGSVQYAAMAFGSCGVNAAHLQALGGSIGTIGVSGLPYRITGGAGAHYWTQGGQFSVSNTSITLSGNPSFSLGFCLALVMGAFYIDSTSTTFTGTAVGRRYNADSNSLIDTVGGGTSFLPGNSAGTTTNGGVYM
jgi:hypothetical protein